MREFSLQVETGEILGLIGPNGAGKTTVFNLIMGKLKPDSGRIFFKGRDITGFKTYEVVQLGIARVFQIARSFPSKTVFENLEICTISNQLFSTPPPRLRKSKVLEVSKVLNLTSELAKLPGSLSQGLLKKLEIAKAVITDPQLLLLDEPFAGLINSEVSEIISCIKQERERGKTIVIVDHNMEGLMQMVDRVMVIHFGKNLAEGTPAELIQNRQVQEAYLGGGG